MDGAVEALGSVRTMTKSDGGFRIEHDSMGEVRVPVNAKYAPRRSGPWRTSRSRATLERRHIRRWPDQGEAAQVNAGLGGARRRQAIADAIAAAADEVAEGEWDEEFPIDVFQTGSGTSSNMNINEVLATLASEKLGGGAVHPNDHVNASQSSNDVFPTAIHVAAAAGARDDLLPALDHLAASLGRKADESATSSSPAAPTSWTPPR